MYVSRVGKNLIYQSLYQALKIMMPLITVPIVSHSLGASGVGHYAFTASIAQYFVMLTALGLPIYGTREIAKVANNIRLLSENFWNFEFFSIILTFIMIFVYLIIGIVFDLGKIYFIQSLLVIGAGLDISWLFMGIEDFKKITVTNFLLQLVSLILIVTQIHMPSDLTKYTIILTATTLFNQAALWLFLKNKVIFVWPKYTKMVAAFYGSFLLFIPEVAIVLYTNVNKTMLGIIGNKSFVGVFSNAILVTTVIITLISSIDTVLMPHATRLFMNNQYIKGYTMVKNVLDMESYITIAIASGIIAISDKFAPWFFGNSFGNIPIVLSILSVLVIVIPGGMTISKQFLIPQGRIKEYNLSVYMGAILSIIFNIILIPVMNVVGAAIVSITVEFLIWVIRVCDFWKYTGLSYDFRQFFSNILSGIAMITIIRLVTNSLSASLLTTFLQVAIGFIVYVCLTTLSKSNPYVKHVFNFKHK
ncbi:oligosaccharide flippase family protein [Leuconostoc citreum]|uniref:oligosaccharide flippase family protein n=1 Tax=Leuconostoc citreum TaxID=33964 RepID=UPI0021A63CDC|nr:oligosaccharide flippase family protein [Leuconostoc citreum]